MSGMRGKRRHERAAAALYPLCTLLIKVPYYVKKLASKDKPTRAAPSPPPPSTTPCPMHAPCRPMPMPMPLAPSLATKVASTRR